MKPSLDIVSVGMVTAVGLDAPSSCAAMRARLDGFQETRFNGPRGGRLVGAPVPLPRNWIGEKRAARLAAGAICEAFEAAPAGRGQTALILCVAEEERPGRPVAAGERVLRMVAELAELDDRCPRAVVAYGRPSGHVALDRARRMIAGSEIPYVMVAGVDSYLTSAAVSHYLADNRLLTPGCPDGFIPGEAAAAALCGATGTGRLHLFGLGLAREKASIYNRDDLPLRGDGMIAAYRMALDEADIGMNRVGYRIADLIGEQYWFKQSALASLRLVRGRHEDQDLWSPAESLGNVGAAVVPLMLGMAWTASKKNYTAGNPVLIEASSDAGACAAAIFAARPA